MQGKYGCIVNLEQFATDGRLTEPSDGRVFDYRKMRDIVNRLGRSMTEEEAKPYLLRSWA